MEIHSDELSWRDVLVMALWLVFDDTKLELVLESVWHQFSFFLIEIYHYTNFIHTKIKIKLEKRH